MWKGCEESQQCCGNTVAVQPTSPSGIGSVGNTWHLECGFQGMRALIMRMIRSSAAVLAVVRRRM
jgi:hypothetical protein